MKNQTELSGHTAQVDIQTPVRKLELLFNILNQTESNLNDNLTSVYAKLSTLNNFNRHPHKEEAGDSDGSALSALIGLATRVENLSREVGGISLDLDDII
jgi:hypothetical protein